MCYDTKFASCSCCSVVQEKLDWIKDSNSTDNNRRDLFYNSNFVALLYAQIYNLLAHCNFKRFLFHIHNVRGVCHKTCNSQDNHDNNLSNMYRKEDVPLACPNYQEFQESLLALEAD